MTRIRNMLDGWLAAFSFLDLETQIGDIDNYVNVYLYRLFRNFELDFNKRNIESISFRGKSNKVLAITPATRKKLGIAFCSEIYRAKKAGMMPLNERVRLLLNT